MTLFKLEIITPESKLFDGECLQADIPGSEGRLGILAHHMNFISSLVPGLVEIYFDGHSSKKLVIADGLIEVNANKCILLVEQATNLEKLNAAEIEAKIGVIRHQLHKADTMQLKHSLQTELTYLEEILKQIAH